MDVNPAAGNGHPKAHAARAHAHGVVAKLGTGHFNPVAEARLSARFGHRVEQPTPPDDAVNDSRQAQFESRENSVALSIVVDNAQPGLTVDSQRISDNALLPSVRVDSPDQPAERTSTRGHIDLKA